MTGDIDTIGDGDWFAVTLEAGKTYRFDLEGANTDAGTLVDPHLYGIHDATGALIEGTTNGDGGEYWNSRVTYTATEAGIHYVAAGSFGTTRYFDEGTYTLSVEEVEGL